MLSCVQIFFKSSKNVEWLKFHRSNMSGQLGIKTYPIVKTVSKSVDDETFRRH